MKRLSLPAFSAADAVGVCASGITNPERAQILRDALPVINRAEVNYLELGAAGRLFAIAESPNVTPQLTTELMGLIYRSHFSRAGSPSRRIYDAIRMAPAHGICPLCGQRIVASVDHYLPQTRHPVFNLTPANLIPACSDCNKNKLARIAGNAEQQSLHPYFDNLGNERWLVAVIAASEPPTISFRVQPVPGWSSVLASRVVHHFNLMGLAELYSAQAASELADISYGIVEIGRTAGPDGVRSHLDGEFRSRYARDTNSWKTALYEGLRDSEWFCTEGFRLV